MAATDIPPDQTELLSVLLESLLYGFSLLLFGVTLWTWLSQRCTQRASFKTIAAAILLLLSSTAHLVVSINRNMEGLILYRDTYPGGPVGYFLDVSQWTFVVNSYIFIAQTIMGDGIVLWRCYVVWESKLVMIVPTLLWCATIAIGIVISYIASIARQNGVFAGCLSHWITAFWITTLASSLTTTSLLVFRIWRVSRRYGGDRLRPFLQSFIDAGAFYSVVLLVGMACFLSKSNGQFVVVNTLPPIISITFYAVIIRVGLAAQNNDTNRPLLGDATPDDNRDVELGPDIPSTRHEEGQRSL